MPVHALQAIALIENVPPSVFGGNFPRSSLQNVAIRGINEAIDASLAVGSLDDANITLPKIIRKNWVSLRRMIGTFIKLFHNLLATLKKAFEMRNEFVRKPLFFPKLGHRGLSFS